MHVHTLMYKHMPKKGFNQGDNVPFMVVEPAANCDSNFLVKTARRRWMKMEL